MVTTIFYLVCSGSGLAVVSIIFLLLLSFIVLCAKFLFSTIILNKYKFFLTTPTFEFKVSNFLYLLLVIAACVLLYSFSSRLTNILFVILGLDLQALFSQSSHRPSFFLASFLSGDFFTLVLGHGASYWHGNYINNVFDAADLIGQSSGLRIVNLDRINLLRLPSTLAFTFYFFVIAGLLLLFASYRLYFLALLNNLNSSRIILPVSVFPVIVSETITLLLVPGLGFNQVNLLPSSVLILLFHHFYSDKNASLE